MNFKHPFLPCSGNNYNFLSFRSLSIIWIWFCELGQGRAGQGRAGQGRAGQGRAGQGRAGQGRAGQGRLDLRGSPRDLRVEQ